MIKCIFNNIHVIGSKFLFLPYGDTSLTKHKSFIFNSTFDVIHCNDCNVDSQSSKFLPCYADEY